MFENFYGNRSSGSARADDRERKIPQTILLAGPEGVGKATLVRRFAARLLKDGEKVERDNLSLPRNVEYIAEREKWPADNGTTIPCCSHRTRIS